MEKSDLIKKLQTLLSEIFPNKQTCDIYLQDLSISKNFGKNYYSDDFKYVFFQNFNSIIAKLDLVETVSAIYNLQPYIQIDIRLFESFCQYALYIIMTSGKCDDIEKNKIIDYFIAYLDKIPNEINYFCFPNNLTINIPENHSKLDDEVEITNYQNTYFHYQSETPIKLSLKQSNDFFKVKILIEKLFVLFDIGNITLDLAYDNLSLYIKNFFNSKKENLPNLITSNNPYLSWEYNYEINNSNIAQLKDFIKSFRPLLENLEFDNFINIAIDFYKDGLAKLNSLEQIAYGVIALESLYNTDKNEIKRALSQRCSKLLGYISIYDALEVEEDIKKAYDFRSSFVHGDKKYQRHLNKKNKPRELAELAHRIFDYVRVSIIMFLQLQNNFNLTKKEINKEWIDKALICENDNQKLKIEITQLNFVSKTYSTQKTLQSPAES